MERPERSHPSGLTPTDKSSEDGAGCHGAAQSPTITRREAPGSAEVTRNNSAHCARDDSTPHKEPREPQPALLATPVPSPTATPITTATSTQRACDASTLALPRDTDTPQPGNTTTPSSCDAKRFVPLRPIDDAPQRNIAPSDAAPPRKAASSDAAPPRSAAPSDNAPQCNVAPSNAAPPRNVAHSDPAPPRSVDHGSNRRGSPRFLGTPYHTPPNFFKLRSQLSIWIFMPHGSDIYEKVAFRCEESPPFLRFAIRPIPVGSRT